MNILIGLGVARPYLGGARITVAVMAYGCSRSFRFDSTPELCPKHAQIADATRHVAVWPLLPDAQSIPCYRHGNRCKP